MPVYKDGYYCHVCEKTVKAKIRWSNKENDLVASCAECGADLQRVIPAPVSKLIWPKGYVETFSGNIYSIKPKNEGGNNGS